MKQHTYGLELERNATGWELRWPQAQLDAYGIDAILNYGSGDGPTQLDYDMAMFGWAIGHLMGRLPPPLGGKDAREILRDMRQEQAAQNAPSTRVLQ